MALACVAIAVLGAGCQAGKGGAGTHTIPDLPRSSAMLAPGETAIYRGDSFRYISLEEAEEGGPMIRVGITRGKERSVETWPAEQFRLEGETLIRTELREQVSATASDGRLALFSFVHLPALTGPDQLDPAAAPLTLREGEVRFFQGGFVSLEEVYDNDYQLYDDDRARLVFSLNGEMYDWKLTEYHAREAKDWLVGLHDVFTGYLPGEGVAVVTLRPATSAWDGAIETAERLLPPDAELQWGDVTLGGEYLPFGEEPLAVLTVREGEKDFSTLAREGEYVRLGPLEVQVRSMDDAGVFVKAARFDESLTPILSRTAPDPRATPAQTGNDPTAPTESQSQTHRMHTGDSIDFWGAKIELLKVHEGDPTNLSDEEAEFVVTWDKRYQTFVIGEGRRESIAGSRRWWLLLVDEAWTLGPEGEGAVVLRLQTGPYASDR
ncbi:MAG: hypothetical protein PWP23_2212 [Candidatus Sumerlaeota bacterium]|nr:hypothetical protein [Candidatus Sumerlaeota bacterium]